MNFLAKILLIAILSIGFSSFAQTNDNFNRYTITPFFLKHGSDHGGGIAYSSMGTNYIGYGAAFAAIYEKKQLNFYNATLSLKAGRNFNLTKSLSSYIYLETGPAINLKDINTVYYQDVVGVGLSYSLKNKESISLGFGVGNNTKWGNDRFYLFTTSLSF